MNASLNQILDANVGQIKAIKVWHDNSGVAPGWFLSTVLVRPTSTTITGKQEKHDSEIKQQLEKLRKKFKIRELRLNEAEPSNKNKNKKDDKKRSKSADPSKSSPRTPEPTTSDVKQRSSSADPSGSVNYKDVLKKNFEKNGLGLEAPSPTVSRASPTPSILKTSASPRTKNESMKKSVKFNSQDIHHNVDDPKPESGKNEPVKQEPPKPAAPKTEMSISWVMSIKYDDRKNIDFIETIEDHDKMLKNIDNKLIAKYDANLAKSVSSTQTKEKVTKEIIESDAKKSSKRRQMINQIIKFMFLNAISG